MSYNWLMVRDWKEEHRMRAVMLKGKGWKQNDIAEALGVTKGAVSQWLKTASTESTEALRARPHRGSQSRLSNEQINLVPEYLSHGAEAYGFRGEVWTCARVGKVIEQEFAVTYDKSHVSRLLKGLGWTPQKPIERAAQRDEADISRWRKQVWGDLKKRLGWSAVNLFSWTNRAFTCCQDACGHMRRVPIHLSCESFKPATICRP